MVKPHRFLLERMTGYAEEAAAYARRRRLSRQPFARVYYPGGRAVAYSASTEAGRRLFRTAADVIGAARE